MQRLIPSPSMAVALLALVLATTGTAVAAVNYAQNAGKVDGKDAVASSATRAQAAGNVVATASKGDAKGTIPGKFVNDVMRGGADSFARPAVVNDNANDVATAIGSIPGLGTLSASCFDQNKNAGVEDPATTLTFANVSAGVINLSREVPGQAPLIATLAPNTTSTFTIGGSNTFRLHLELNGINYVLEGVVRQDGRNTPDARCLVYGYALRISDTR
ncbi:hypothetical protein LRS13_22430 [Svornostia abyssi]|uniref:Uncharacterized protein n=1 Tax=Svornostia abyssi TaxID=2898438 RepID=A0ABY5PFG1_9ACTN|nr:hypothetical protein LRS13_22430 [Parviterribacteraceae bacterium J379]